MPPALSRIFVSVLALTTFGALAQDQDALLLQQARALFKTLPANFAEAQHPITSERVELGKALFFDPRWSVDRNVSCATCHNPGLYGADALSKSIGVKSKQHPRNAPTVLNMAGHVSAHWRGGPTEGQGPGQSTPHRRLQHGPP